MLFRSKAIEKAKNKNKRKALLVCTLLLDFGVLFFFKYLGFTVRNLNRLFAPYHGGEAVLPVIKLVLPLGISFYTFQLASYVLDVYGKKVRAERKFTDFGTYLCMFPQLIAGPIVKYTDMAGQLKKRKYLSENLEEGLKTFTLGLASKMLLANPCGAFWNRVQVIGFESISTGMAWLGAFSFTFQIYFDFNGYSLMAMGLCSMLEIGRASGRERV